MTYLEKYVFHVKLRAYLLGPWEYYLVGTLGV